MTEYNPYETPLSADQDIPFPELYQIVGVAAPLIVLGFSFREYLERGTWPSLEQMGSISLISGLAGLTLGYAAGYLFDKSSLAYGRYQFKGMMKK